MYIFFKEMDIAIRKMRLHAWHNNESESPYTRPLYLRSEGILGWEALHCQPLSCFLST